MIFVYQIVIVKSVEVRFFFTISTVLVIRETVNESAAWRLDS